MTSPAYLFVPIVSSDFNAASPASEPDRPATPMHTQLPFQRTAAVVTVESRGAARACHKPSVSMAFTREELRDIPEDSRQAAVLRSLIRTFENDPQDTFNPVQIKDHKLSFQFDHEEYDQNEDDHEKRRKTAWFNADCTLDSYGRVQTLTVKELPAVNMKKPPSPSVEERKDESTPPPEVLPFFELTLSNTAKRQSSPLQRQWTKQVKQTHGDPAAASRESSTTNDALTNDDAPHGIVDEEAEAEPVPASFVLPDTMRLAPAIRKVLEELQEELDHDESASLAQRTQGPRMAMFCQKIQSIALEHWSDSSRWHALSACRKIDIYLSQSKVSLATMLADVCTFENHLRAAATQQYINNSQDMSVLRSMRNAFYPDTPARQAVREIIASDDNYKNTSGWNKEMLLNFGTHIDVYLAGQGLYLEQLRKRPEAQEDENHESFKRFNEMRKALLTQYPNAPILQKLLKHLRERMQPLPQDPDLRAAIASARHANGDEIANQTRERWLSVASLLAEVLAKEDMPVQDFLAALQAFGKNHAGDTPEQKLKKFQRHTQPFSGFTLNYAQLKETISSYQFDNFLQHFINTPMTAGGPRTRP
jgi:hypothetical protein